MSGFYATEPDPYFDQIEDEIGRVRGKAFHANPPDFRLMELWQSKGVPIHVIIRAIDRPINSLTFVRDEVEKRFDEHLSRTVGNVQPEVLTDIICAFCGAEACLRLHRESVSEDL